MIRNVFFSVLSFILLGTGQMHAQCSNDTIFSDVVFVIDNSGSIDSAEYAAFSNIILATVNKVQAACSQAQVGVVHYGGSFGQETTIEYPLSKNNVITTIDRQYCTSLDGFGFCVGGGGDDLNYAMGQLITYFGNGSLNHDPMNNLSIVIFTDAFDGATSCGQPNCSILRPFDNIDILKSTYAASVTVVGASSQANAAILQVYASPGGTYDLVNLDADCSSTFDGCVQPRKYIPIEFNSDVTATSDSIVSCVECQIQLVSGMMVDAGNMQMICSDLPQTATLMATGSVGVPPYSYNWSHGAGSGATVMVTPLVTTTYYVTATDAINCMDVDSVTLLVQDCCTAFSVNAGADVTICSDLGESTTLTATTTGSGSATYNWDNGLGAGASHVVSPSSTTTYGVTATSSYGCVETDQVTVTADICGPDCDPDTTFTDIIFLLDNSGSIDDSEFSAFENIILASLSGLRTSCPSSRRSIVHYGGINGTSTAVEYSLGQVSEITTINRQFCTSRTTSGICIGGGGDDLNNAIGDIMTFLNNGMLNRDPSNNLALVIFTDAFGFDTTCGQPNCSLILPTTNIDMMKADYDVDVSVVGISSQAEEVLLGIYASPGGTFNSPLYQPECTGSFDGCSLPRKYEQIEFNTPPATVASMITSFVDCVIEIEPELSVDLGPDQTYCTNLGGSATLTATIGVNMGVPPYSYLWSDGLGTNPSVIVTPPVPQTYSVTVTDANLCSAVDSILVTPVICNDCFADAGTPQPPLEQCLDNGLAFLPAHGNSGVFRPAGYEEIFILTNEDLLILDYSIGFKNFRVNETGQYRVHTLIAEVTNPASDDYLDLNIIKINQSELFIVVNCIQDHGICAAFDFPGRVHLVFGPEDMMCMTFENSINLCRDGIDNDGDGLVDCADEDCKELINCLENTLIACNDLTDNDGDGLIDCDDPDCFQFTKCFERGDQCRDGIDNDGDGLVDCLDPSCFDSAWCEENNAFTCKDGLDNDRDGLIDCQEASCKAFIVCAESSIAACEDGLDNDRDGLVDCEDADCKAILGDVCTPKENDPALCMDGLDNDGDGLVDCADSDCLTADLINVDNNIDGLIETTSATCPNNNNGVIRFIGIAQNSAFQYSIDGGQTFFASHQFNQLNTGSYLVGIKSALGCALYWEVTISGEDCIEICNNGVDDDGNGLIDCADNKCNNPDPHSPQVINVMGATCPDYNNGAFSIAGMPGNVQYSLDGINYQSTPIFSGLSDGTYRLRYRDPQGCYDGLYVIIKQDVLDQDGDGICDDEDDCPELNNALIGTPCDDSNPCTVDDTYTNDCNCVGVVQDSDGDGVCDAEDICPDADDNLIGTPCDDGDSCTADDVYDTACNCVGTIQDSDGDGVCDADDVCPDADDSLIGTPCDDGNACTVDDIITDQCTCMGTLQDADGDGVCDADDVCPDADDSLIGTPCDDGNACTVDDIITEQCTCMGTLQDADGDGVCDADDVCPGADDTMIGAPCDDGDPCTINDTLDNNCNCTGTIQDTDGDGTCDALDPCPLLANTAPGTACDDGNPQTINDVFDNDCNCQGELFIPDEICDNGIDDDFDGLVDCADNDCGVTVANFVIRPDASSGKDANLHSIFANDNYPDEEYLYNEIWTASGQNRIKRSLFDFVELKNYEGNKVENAQLTLYGNPDYVSASNGQYGDNELQIRLITESWEEDQVTYANQPPTSDQFITTIPSQVAYDSIVVDITEAINEYLNGGYHGFLMDHVSQTPYRAMIFYSSDASDEKVRPKLNLQMTGGLMVTDATCPNLDNGRIVVTASSGSSDNTYRLINKRTVDTLVVNADVITQPCSPDDNFGDNTNAAIIAWTFASAGCTIGCFETRGYFNFDWSAIPLNATINSARFTFESHEFIADRNCESGPNTSVIRRVSEAWTEGGLTFNNAPAATTDNEVLVPSLCAEGDVADVDVKELVVDILANRNAAHGFELSLQNPDCYKGFVIDSRESGKPVKLIVDYTVPDTITQTSPVFDNLRPGEYTLQITSVTGCSTEVDVTINGASCPEICDNGIDDDEDGRVDCEDDDCIIEVHSSITVKMNTTTGYDSYVTNEAPFIEENYGSAPTLVVNEWAINPDEVLSTHSHVLLDFPIDQYLTATGLSLESATITLYDDPQYEAYEGGQFGENDALVHLLNEPWDEGSVKWENRPNYHTSPFSVIPQNNNYDQLSFDVTNLLDMAIDEELDFFGFIVHPQEKSPFRSLSFASRENPDPARAPEIHLVFSQELCVNDTLPPTAAASVASISLNINVMLQGACMPDGGLMKTDLNEGGYLPGQEPVTFFGTETPAGQPFNQAPWFYEGTEGANMKGNSKSDGNVYDPDVVDWVLVSLRTDPGKLSEVWRGAALLYNDGSVSFFNDITVDQPVEEGYFVVIEHRNHLPVMSPFKIQPSEGTLTYDFTKQDSYSSILGIGQVRDEWGNYMMVAGNGELVVELSSDIDINTRDLTLWLQNNGANSSYFLEDYDMNGDINIKDRILWEKNNGLFTTLQTK